MKTFNKLLAVVLSLIMLLSVVPVAVFANEPGNNNVVTPGTSEDGTITLTLDSDALVAALKAEKSTDAVIELLKDAIDRSGSTAFTKDELMLLIPVADILNTVKATEPAAYEAILSAAMAAVDQAKMLELVSTNNEVELIAEEFFATKLSAYAEELDQFDTMMDDASQNGDQALYEAALDQFLAFMSQIFDGYITREFTVADFEESTPSNFNYAKILAESGEFSPELLSEITKLIDVRDLLSAVKANLSELASKDLIEDLALVVILDVVSTIDLLKIEGYQIAYDAPDTLENASDWFELDFENAARAIKKIMPTFTELANAKDGKLLSFNMELEYARDGVKVEKDLQVEIVLDGCIDTFCKYAQKMADHITVDRDGNDLYIDVTMPTEVTKALAWYLESCPEGESIKTEILGLADMTGADLVAALENLTWDRMIALFKTIDVENLYYYIMTVSKVQTVLDRIEEELELSYDLNKFTDLNMLLDELTEEGSKVSGVTLNKIFNRIEDAIKVDVQYYLGKVVTRVENSDNATLEKCLTKLRNAPYLGKYVTKFENEYVISELMNNYGDMPIVDAFAAFIEKELDNDLKSFLNNNDANEIYDRIIQEVEERSSTVSHIFERCKDYMLAAADPDYTANSRWGKLIQAMIPDEVYALENKALANAYRGNGKFELIDKKFENLNLSDNADNLLAALLDIVELDDQYVELINHFMPTELLSDVSFGLHVNVTFPEVSRATFLNKEGTVAKVMFLPNGAHPGRFYTIGEDFSFWVDENNVFVPVITKDVILSPVSGFITGGYLEIDEDGNWTITSTTENFNIVVNLDSEDDTVLEMIEALKNANSVTFANVQGLKMTMDRGMLAEVLKNSSTSFTVSYAANRNSGKITSANGLYSFVPEKVDSFNLTTDSTPMTAFGEESFKITIPFRAATDKTAVQMTNVYNVVDGKLTEEELAITVNKGESVVLDAKHFSDYVVFTGYNYTTNLYLNGAADPTAHSETSATDAYIPEGATVKIVPKFSYRPGKRITSVYYNGARVALGTEITMPAKAISVDCYFEYQAGKIVYNVFGKYFDNEGDANDELTKAIADGKLPKGYTVVTDNDGYAWNEPDAQVVRENIYVAPALKAITFKVVFPDGIPAQTFKIGELNSFTLPAATDAKNGYVGYWAYKGEKLDPAKIIANTTITSADTDEITIEVTKAYEGIEFFVYMPDGSKKPVACGSELEAAKYVIVSNDKNNGKVVEAKDGKFYMPASDVKMIVEVTYTVNGVEYKAELGSTASFTITVNPGGKIVTAPVGCTAKSLTVVNGVKTYTYTFEVVQNLAFTYSVAEGLPTVELVNGMENKDTETQIKGLKFKAFSEALTLNGAKYQFALYETEEKSGSLLWLWILLALVVIIGAIVLIYNLYIREKMKPSFVTRAATWVVNLFFKACLGVSAVFLWITQGTTKKGEIDYEEIGMNSPEDMVAAEDAEETAETTDGDDAVAAVETVETEEVAVDEAAEVVANEASEETAEANEEITEVAEETAEEAVEEAAEEVTEVAQEVVAEDVAAEAAEETDDKQD